MTDYFDQAERLILSGNVGADAAAVAYAVLALTQALTSGCGCCEERPVITPNIKGGML